jgi:hypothetical protein
MIPFPPAEILIPMAILLFIVFLASGLYNLTPSPTIAFLRSLRTNKKKEDRSQMKVTLKGLKTYDDMNGQLLVDIAEFEFEGEKAELEELLEGLNIKQ